jgi:hypothetical protein
MEVNKNLNKIETPELDRSLPTKNAQAFHLPVWEATTGRPRRSTEPS